MSNNIIFKKGYSLTLDKLKVDLDQNTVFFDNIVNKLNDFSSEFKDFFKVDKTEKSGYSLSITSKRFTTVKKSIIGDLDLTFNNNKCKFSDLIGKMNTSKTTTKISCPIFDIVNKSIVDSKDNLKEQLNKEYNKFCKLLLNNFKNFFKNIINSVSLIDFFANNAFNSIKYNYTKPIISDENDNKAFLKIKEIRHPLIEQIQTELPYITNDIEIGIEQKGMLIYGCNSVGKSSLMKAVGLSIILAQMGSYVPNSNMIYYPYKAVFSRIPSGDNLHQGQSSFIVELSELRNILKKADENSLIIGDEIMSSTESISAISIVSATIMELSNNKSNFVFATHLHELKELEEITSIDTLKIYHLTIRYDPNTGILIFDRKLKEGFGDSNYGLEIARSFLFENEFMKNAENIKKKLLKIPTSIIGSKKSRYNNDKRVIQCELCSKTNGLETHHIFQQKDADHNGNINKKFHKNQLHNLAILCSECHDKLHKNDIRINGYVKTSNGIIIDTN